MLSFAQPLVRCRLLTSCLHVASTHSTIYNMCTQKPPHDYSEQLYGLYKDAFSNYITNKVCSIFVLSERDAGP